MRRITLFLTSLFCVFALALAQNKTVRGVVISAEDNEPLPGVNLVVKGQETIGGATNLDGKFSFSVPASAKVLKVSSVGFKTIEVPITSGEMRIVLQSDSQMTDELVVVAYGVQKKESLVGSQSTVSAKTLEKRPISNVTTALSGLTPGVQTTLNTGQPGSSADIRIRGIGSMNASSAPIIVVDGSIFDGSIADINPQDIQSLSVLKDAASTAIYGSSSGNGVVLITTKSGQGATGGKPVFNFAMSQGFSRRGQADYEKVGAADHYRLRWLQWFHDYKLTQGWTPEKAGMYASHFAVESLGTDYNPFSGITKKGAGGLPLIVMEDGTMNPEITGLAYADDMDWEGALFKTGHRQEYTLSGNYSTNNLRSYFSLSYLNEDGYRINTHFKRFTGRMNLSYKANDWLEAGTAVSFTNSNNTAPKNASGSYSSNSFNFVRNMAPIYPIHVHNSDGSYVLDANGNKIYDYSPARPYNGRFNPVYEAELDKSYFVRDLLTTRSFVRLTPVKGLALTANVNYDVTNQRMKTRYNNIMGDQPIGLLMYDPNRYETLLMNQLADYSKSFGNHNFQALIGHESYEYTTSLLESYKTIATVTGVDEYSNYAATGTLLSEENKYTKESFFGRLNYDYDSRYNASFSFRRDGTSRFHRDNRWGTFWSVGLGWNLHRESFLKNARWIDVLKLRGSYGQTGNDLLKSYYPYRTIYELGHKNLNNPAILFSVLGNEKLRWESQVSTDLALEFALFKNKLSGTIEFFNKESSDLLFGVRQPISTGLGTVSENIGKVRNWGVEFDLKWRAIQTNDFSWTINLNGTHVRNRIMRLPDAQRKLGIIDGIYKYMEGTSVYEYYLYDFKGVDPTDGLPMYLTDDEAYPDAVDPKSPDFVGVDKEGERAAWTKEGKFAKKVLHGSALPVLQGGFGTELTWKDFDMSMSFAYQLGGKAYDGAYASLMARDLNSGSAAHVDLLNSWTESNTTSNIPRLDAGAGGQYSTLSSQRWLTSRTSLMLKSLTFGYTLPKAWLNRFGISNAKFTLAGENLFLLSKRKGFNPMDSFSGEIGAAYYGYAKTVTASLSLSF